MSQDDERVYLWKQEVEGNPDLAALLLKERASLETKGKP